MSVQGPPANMAAGRRHSRRVPSWWLGGQRGLDVLVCESAGSRM